MLRFFIASVFPAVTAGLGAALVASWLGTPAPAELGLRIPAAVDPGWPTPPEKPVEINGFFAAGPGQPGHALGDWPGFRGANRDGVGRLELGEHPAWPASGPPALWAVELGEGYAGAAVAEGRVYLLDYDQKKKADTLRCLSLDDGREIWRRGYNVLVKRNHGMSRTVPAVSGDYVVTLGPRCQVMCCDARSGQLRWGIDLVKQYGATEPEWYAAQCPLIDDGKAILAPAGSALMVAIDCASGKEVWRAENSRRWRMTHSSIVPATIAGVKMYVYCASGGVAAVEAATGKVLWLYDGWTVNMANSPSPVAVAGDRLFFSGGYNAGCMMLRVSRDQAGFSLQEVFRLPARDFGSEQQTPVLYGDRLYGVREDGQLVCLDTSGKLLWTSGRGNRFGQNGRGPYMIAGDKLLVLDGEGGKLSLVATASSGFRPLGQWRVLTGADPWAPMALAGGRLLVRDLTRMVCLDLAGGTP